MKTIVCPKCGTKVYGKPFCDYDDKGNLIQLIDFSCSTCGLGWIHNPKI